MVKNNISEFLLEMILGSDRMKYVRILADHRRQTVGQLLNEAVDYQLDDAYCSPKYEGDIHLFPGAYEKKRSELMENYRNGDAHAFWELNRLEREYAEEI